MAGKRRGGGYKGSRKGGDPAFQAKRFRSGIDPETIEEDARGGVPRRKYAIVFGYFGTGFHGMQKQVHEGENQNVRTIEGDLEDALVKCDALSPQQLAEPERLQWSRVGRTDKGVHAACQVVTMKLSLGPLTPEEKAVLDAAHQFEEGLGAEEKEKRIAEGKRVQREREVRLLRKLQAAVPAELKVFDVTKVMGTFDARLKANKRQYEYCLPSWVLRKLQLSDNKEILYDYFARYASTETIQRTDAGEDDKKQEPLCIDRCFVPFHLKQKALAAFPDSLVDIPPLKECSLASQGDTTNGTDIVLTDESPIGDILLTWRRELWLTRKAYARLDGTKRDQLWNEFPQDFRQAGTIPPYPPFSLTALRAAPITAEEKASCKLDDKDMERFQSLLDQFSGSHHWYNFTSRLSSDDASGHRNVHSMKVYRAFHDPVEGEILVVRIIGQSFLLNQIRKMMSIAIESFVGTAPFCAPQWLYSKPLTPKKHLHLAPGEGLLLERAYFDVQNRVKNEDFSRMILHHDYECEQPFGSKIEAFLTEGKAVKIAEKVLRNTLLDDDEEEAPQDVAEANAGVTTPYTCDWINVPAEDRPTFWKILDFKFNSLYPWTIKVFREDFVWQRYLNDIQWHPFFSENFPVPIATDVLYPNNSRAGRNARNKFTFDDEAEEEAKEELKNPLA